MHHEYSLIIIVKQSMEDFLDTCFELIVMHELSLIRFKFYSHQWQSKYSIAVQ